MFFLFLEIKVGSKCDRATDVTDFPKGLAKIWRGQSLSKL